MKTKILLITTVLFISISMLSQNTRKTYDSEWKEVENFTKQSLPKSAIQKTETILQQAISDKNTPQIMRAYSSLYTLNNEIDLDNEFNYISKLEELLKQTESPTDKALIHSILADIYYQNYSENRWSINQRTNLADNIVPEDIKAWSANTYINKINEHLQAAIKNKEVLLKDTTKSYDDIVELGEDSRTYRPTLYDFVMTRTIETAQSLNGIGYDEFDPRNIGSTLDQLILPAGEYIKLKLTPSKKYAAFSYYQQYLSDLQSRGLTDAIVLVELDKLTYLGSLSQSLDNSKMLEVLFTLEKLYSNNETTVEIIDCIAKALNTNKENYNYLRDSGILSTDDDKKNSNLGTYQWLQKGIERYPNYKRINILKNRLASLEAPSIQIQGNNLFFGKEKIELDVIHKNSQKINKSKKVRLYQVQDGKERLYRTLSVDFRSKTTYDADTNKLTLGYLPMGRYYLKSNFKDDEHADSKFEFSVSDLMTYSRNASKDKYEIFVVDRKNGKPIEGATVTIYEQDEKEKKKTIAALTTNDMGLAVYDDTTKKEGYYYDVGKYTVSYGKDNGLPELNLYGQYNNYGEHRPVQIEQNTISLFSDRSIYRSGQTVYYKAIVIDKNSKVVANSKQNIQLYNRNNEVVAENTSITNEYGSIAGEFILPQNGLLGSYRIQAENHNSMYLQVEEYKRPTFEVKFDEIDKTFSFGDTIIVKGNAKSYSGISLQDANVKYRVSRRPLSFWGWGGSAETHFENGTVKTKNDGSFEIAFTPEAGDGHKFFRQNIYNFEITAEVTDLNGETRSAAYTLPVGDVSMILNINIPTQVEKSQDLDLEISAKNLKGTDIQTLGTYTIYSLTKDNSVITKVLDGKFSTGKQSDLATKIKSLGSGKLRIEIKGKDDKKKDVSNQSDFVLYSYDDKKPPYETNEWLVNKKATFKAGQAAEIIYGTSNQDAYILYNIYNNQKSFERRFVNLSNENQTFSIPYQADFGDEVYVSFTSVKDGELKTSSTLLKKEEEKPDTQLNIKVNTFRDKLRPGQKETWTLSIRDAKENPVSAEVLASMYDISLDQIYPLAAWMLSKSYINKEYLRQINFDYRGIYKDSYSFNFNYDSNNLKVNPFDFDTFKYGLDQYYSYLIRQEVLYENMVTAVPAPSTKSKLSNASMSVEDTMEAGEGLLGLLDMEEQKVDAGGSNAPTGQQAQIRRNFNETAFFFPQLQTNEKKETVISFTVPESNTTWRFRAFAHDKNSKVGELEKMVVTRKELMVTPNMPRFIRHGDKTSISTKISNLSESTIIGEVYIEFFNPMDEKKINLKIKEPKQRFTLEKEASTSATWTFDVPDDIDLIGVRIVAGNKKFSDGEQHALAVLPNKMLVTETMPFDVTETGEQSFVFEKMEENKSTTLSNYKLTLEFASNPVWYAIQALPVMSNPTDENAVSWFASYYVNKLGASLMKQYPKVANVIEAWTKQGGTKGALASNLNKNEELKTILQEETPWVLDAKSETEQMRRLALLFDINNSKYQTETAVSKLQELQMQDGGWSWYKDLYANRSVTQYLLYGLAELQLTGMVEYPEDVKTMQMNALNYVDKKITEDYNSLKKYNDKWQEIKSISTSQLEYLYIRSKYRDIPISQEAREAERFYTNVISTNWTTINLYEKSLLAVLTKELGQKGLAEKITKSIKEHAVEDKELGMYWTNNKNNVFLSMSAVSTHTFMMEALKANGASIKEMDMMKRWLVKQKQTQIWESTHATIDAINMLMKEGSDWLTTDAQPTIKIGGKAIIAEHKELGTGYIKTSWSGSDIKNNMSKININSVSSAPAYGSLYWQYYENLDKITKQNGALDISKELYREVVSESGKQLEKITEDKPLSIGDKVIVRLVVKSDRNMEFVQLKDMRAACFEPIQTISGTSWQNNALFYNTTKDASTNFFFDVLPKGTYVFEYALYVSRSGEYSNGITSVQCAYAPEFTSHTAGITVKVVE